MNNPTHKKVRFGANQAHNPAPAGYRNFRRAWNTLLAPAVSASITGWGLSNEVYVSRALLVVTLVTAVINGIDIFLGGTDVLISEDLLPQKQNNDEKE